jgi:hypothetical protein
MDTHRLRFRSLASRPKENSEKPIVIELDNNGSLTHWVKYSESIKEAATANTAKLLNLPDVKENTAVVVTTGRAFTGAQKVGDFYRNVPIDFWGTTNGFALFVNKKHQSAPEWIRGLTLDQQDPGWQAELKRKYHWDLSVLTKTMFAMAEAAGFKPISQYGYQAYDSTRTVWGRPNPVKWPTSEDLKGLDYGKIPKEDMLMVSFYPDGTSLIFEKPSGPLTKDSPERKFMLALTQQIHLSMRKQGLSARLREGPYRHTLLYDYVPPIGDGKKILTQYILTQYLKSVKERVPTGDNHFDLDYMRPKFLRLRDTETGRVRVIRSSPVQVGEEENLHRVLWHHPRYVQAPVGQLYEGLQKQLAGIAKRLKLPMNLQFTLEE